MKVSLSSFSVFALFFAILYVLLGYLVLYIPPSGYSYIFLMIGLAFNVFLLSKSVEISKRQIMLMFWAFALFFSMFFSIFIQNITGVLITDENGVESQSYMINSLRTAWFFFLGGGALSFVREKKSNMWSFFILICFLLILIFPPYSGFSLNYNELEVLNRVNKISHLSFEFATIFILAYAYSLSKGLTSTLVFIFICLLLIPFGGVAMQFLLPIAILIDKVFISRNPKKMIFLFMLSISVFLVSFYYLGGFVLFEHKYGSFLERITTLVIGVKDLDSQFLYGNPVLIVDNFGYLTSYIHNFLSVWQYYGFFTFSILLLLMVYFFFFIYKEDVFWKVPGWARILMVYSFSSFALLKGFTYPLFWFMFGFCFYFIVFRMSLVSKA